MVSHQRGECVFLRRHAARAEPRRMGDPRRAPVRARRRSRPDGGERTTPLTGSTAMAFTPFDLTGKVAVVTGGNGGIGLGMAQGLAAAGADIAIWGRNAQKNADALEALKTHGTRVE